MRKLALGCALAALLTVSPARAQIPVTDGGNLVAQAKSLLQDLRSYAVELQQLQQEVQSYVQLATTAASLIQNPSLGAVMGLMNLAGIDNPLPINPYAVQGLLSGYGGLNSFSGLTGRLSNLNGLFTGSLSTDRVYECTTDSFACSMLKQRANGSAGLKSVASSVYKDLTDHVPVLQGLRTQLSTSTDPAQRERIMAEVQIETAWVNNAQAQLSTAVAQADAQRYINETQENEHLSQSISALLASSPYK